MKMSRTLVTRLALWAILVLVIVQVSLRPVRVSDNKVAQVSLRPTSSLIPTSRATSLNISAWEIASPNAPLERHPKIRLHIGPHKTGTSTLQRYTWENRHDLLQDGIWVPKFKGIKQPNFALAHCFIHGYRAAGGDYTTKYCNTRLFRRLQQQLLVLSTENTTSTDMATGSSVSASRPDILIIAEDFDRPTISIPRLLRQFKKYTDSFEITLTYRRLHDWFPSWYNEIMSLYIQKFIGSSKNKTMPSFVEWVEWRFDSFLRRHTEGLLEQYSSTFANTRVMNFHTSDSDILSHYICEILKANHTCDRLLQQYRQSNITGGRVIRASQPMELQRLVIVAHQKGFLSVQTLTVPIVRELSYKWRGFLRNRTSTHEDATWMVCVNATLWQRVWDESIRIESSLFPESVSSLPEQYAKALWDKWCVYDEHVLFTNRSLLEGLKFCDLQFANCSRLVDDRAT